MSFVSIGLDIVDVDAFAAQLGDRASGFVAETFTNREQAGAPVESGRRATYLAGRYAAKEAFLKAWSSTRTGSPPQLAVVDLREIEVVADGFGRPVLHRHGSVLAATARLQPNVSISHDGAMAAAVVALVEQRD